MKLKAMDIVSHCNRAIMCYCFYPVTTTNHLVHGRQVVPTRKFELVNN